MNAIINYNHKKIEINNIEKCSGINKFIGLMFHSKNTNPILFEFSKPTRTSIHSFFCPNFLAIWLNNNKIVEYKIINNWEFSIKPEKEFTKLVEIPVNKTNENLIKLFLVGERKV